MCSNCHRKYEWESQPYIGSIPAGNILTSAAILYSGALPSKSLRVFDILNCSAISRQSYFRHQRDFLQLAVHNVWDQLQQSLLAQFIMNERGLILSGDGRADSPGHSAKFGSYTVIELTCNKVIDFKLVQVRTYH